MLEVDLRRESERERAAVLIQRRLLEAVDDDDLDRPAAGFQLQPELLLHRGEDVRRIGIRGR